MDIAIKKKRRFKPLINAKSEHHWGRVLLEIPMATVSEANCSEAWTKKHRRHQLQRRAVATFLRPMQNKIKLPCQIKLTRLAPRQLDKHDNLPMSFKYIVDACCAIITNNYIYGNADNDDRISICYDQEISKEYGIRIEITWDEPRC